ncbi:Ceramide_synthetase [Hexamita inflata]|uniref:Ceramide synthetase n=1 Tax=Hexamita inflata TaxID=28002 RepID=A0AA86Q2C2_9EUKA|nr:Ceramide synthetase [Hexamita inflata]
MISLTPATSFVLIPPFIIIHMAFRFYFQKFVMHYFRNNINVKKLSECMFYLLQYSVFTLISSTIVIKNKLWWLNYENLFCEKIYMHSFSTMTACYLMLELSVCISTAMTWCFETRKEHADFIMMVVHHACTISLICFSMYSQNYNMGVFTANLHDISDIFLEFSKMIYYLGFTQTSKVTFFLFGVSFIIPRCYVFPKFLIIPFYNGQLDDTLIKLDSNVDLLKAYSKLERTYIPAAFTVLFILNCIWTVAIVNMALKLLIKKEWRDVREKQVSKTD